MFTLERVFFIIRINAILFLSFAKHASGKEFHFARRMKTDFHDDMSVYNFETLTGQSINGCIELCKRKKRCKFINYERGPNLCFLIGIKNEDFQIEDYLEVKPGFYFGDKNEWNMVRHSSVEELTVCESCSVNGVCKIDDGSDHSKCLNSGCGPPEQKENTILLGGMFSVGSRIKYECKNGYKPIKDVPLRSVCLENGTWSAVEVECVLGCGPPEQKENTIVHGEMFTVGNTIEYECKKGYNPIKDVPLRSVCLENGTWSAVEVECVPGCGPPGEKENTIVQGEMFTVGNTVEYECKKGYNPIKDVPLISVCLENGTWSVIEVECVLGCGPPEQKENTIVHGEMFTVGNTIEYECKKGYNPIKDVPLRSVCLENGTWSAIEVECVLGCGPPEQRENTIILGEMFSVGNEIEYQCKEGYKPISDVPLKSMCLQNGTWSVVELECLPEDVYEFQGTFYKLIRETMDWELANVACSSIGGHLVDIKSQEEQNFITETVVDNFFCYWTGATRSGDGFIWSDGTVIEHADWNWEAGQPNNVKNSQDCVELLSKFGYKWNDKQCSGQCHVICEQILM